jgi:hypothetical protein
VIYGIKPVYLQAATRISSEDSAPASIWLVIGACLIALAIGVGLVFVLAWIAAHLKVGPFLVAFVVAMMYLRAFR